MDGASFEPAGFFVLRTPLLPLDALRDWSSSLEAPAAVQAPERLAQALHADRARLRASLRALVTRPEIREAIFLASPGFESRLAPWLEDEDGARGAKIEHALVRYVERAAGRPTPFGLFAGHTLGRVAEATHLELPPRAAYRRRTRLDMRLLFRTTGEMVADPAIRAAMRFVPNGSIHRAGRTLRYVEITHEPQTGAASHRVVSVAPTPYLEATLTHARDGATPGELATRLAQSDAGVSREEALEYIDALIDAKILLPELEPTITTADPAGMLATQLRDLPSASAVRELLERASAALVALDGGGLGASPAHYRALAAELEGLGAAPDASHFVHVNLWKAAPSVTISPALARSLVRAATLLSRVGRPSESDALARFERAFVARYEAREVPLLEALDDDVGVGFDDARGEGTPEVRSRRDAHLMRRAHETIASGSIEWRLDAGDIDALSADPPLELPAAFALLARLERTSPEAAEDETLRVHALGLAGQSGIGVVARLCVFDPELLACAVGHLRQEEALEPHAIVAEIAHAPSAEVANGVLRPALRAHEISCLARSGGPPGGVIPLEDLRVSVVRGRVVLRSVALGRVVLPRNTTAHNAERADSPIYRFLTALARQGHAHGMEWRWGSLSDAPFLPRVVADGIVLASARWRLFADEMRPAHRARSDAERFMAIQALRERRLLPRHVAFVEHDHALRVDLDNVLSLEALLDATKNRDWIDVTEVSSDPQLAPVRSVEGGFAHELVVPFLRRGGPSQGEPRPTAPTVTAHVPRTFIAGSEWLSTKIYLAAASVDELLGELVTQVVGSARDTGAIDRWFFLPMNRPERHLRLRFHGSPAALHARVLPAIEEALAPWLEDGRVRRFEVDTYEREVERYGGGEGIVLAERLFSIDSDAALAVVAATSGREGGEDAEDARWRLVLLGHDAFMSDLGFDRDAKVALMHRVRDAYRDELHVTAEQQRVIGQRFRAERGSIEEMLARAPASPMAFAFPVIARRGTALVAWARDLRAAADRGALSEPVSRLAESYLHVSAGRLLRGPLRDQELLVADMLCRIYESQAKGRPA